MLKQPLVHLHRCCGIGPCWKWVQIKHQATPAVNGQRDAANADNVHHNSCFNLWGGTKKVIMALWLNFLYCTDKTHHVWHFEVTIGKDNSIWRRGHRQHKGEGCAECAGDHHIQRVQADRLRLDQNTEQQLSVIILRLTYRNKTPPASPDPSARASDDCY